MVARVAEACNSRACAHLLVRGDQIEFVSVEQARRVGCGPGSCPTALDERRMPSDIKLPRSYVLVHDTTGFLLSKCELYVVKYRRARTNNVSSLHRDEVEAARAYFSMGDNPSDSIRLETGSVVIPKGPWTRTAKIRLIRYRRHNYRMGFEHLYDPPVWLSSSSSSRAWKLSLPSGCIVHEQGFIKP
jgi:hypothetical protein